ncbi:MAG TPA: hypothetical protein VMV44_14700 [Rectinemataceae bacterium]|nr:hypothetical protein [Rectinemataceae bacterium]
MKFRTIYALFNAIIVVSFLFVFFLPLALLGWDYTLTFWKSSWYLALLFIGLIIVLNAFFMANRKVFGYFEKEDWDGLSAWLVERIFVKHRYGGLHIRYLVDTWFIQGDIEGFSRLEEELRRRKPRLLRKTAVIFGFIRILKGQAAEAESFLKPWLGMRDIDDWEWLRFGYAFALVLQRRVGEARPHLFEGASSRDPVLALLAAWLLDSVVLAAAPQGRDDETVAVVERTKTELRKRFPGAKFGAEVEKAKGEFHVVVLSKPIADARKWLGA